MIILILASLLMAGCAARDVNYDSRPFFQPQQSVELHGRKTWFDHLIEVDPGRVSIKLAQDYAENPPERLAVLPFVDHSNAQFRVNKIALTHRNERQREQWAWTYANRLRRSFAGQMAVREFTIVPMPAIDTVLQDHGIDNWKKLMAVPPQQLGHWLDADTVVYGEVLTYDAYYALLVSAWDVGVKVQFVSTRDGHQLLEASDNRYSVDLRAAFDPLGIGVNSALSLLELRDMTLARAEDEVSREIALRVPVSEKTVTDLQVAARAYEDEDGQYIEARGPQPGYIIPSPRRIETVDRSLDTPLLLKATDPPVAQ
jgi:Putative lipoprotein GNA1162-like